MWVVAQYRVTINLELYVVAKIEINTLLCHVYYRLI